MPKNSPGATPGRRKGTCMATCKKCDSEATYSTPEDLCTEHWAEWWVDGLEPKTPEQREQLTQETMKDLSELNAHEEAGQS